MSIATIPASYLSILQLSSFTIHYSQKNLLNFAQSHMNAEQKRLEEANLIPAGEGKEETWRKWGPYLSERQWSTVREDYSADGNAWDYFPHRSEERRVGK